MRTTILILLVKITFIFAAFCPTSSSQAQQDKFNYSTSVGFILYVDNGGHIFQRPDNAEQRTSFNVAYEIVAKYSSQMQPQHAGLALDISSLPIEERFLLINHNEQKLLFLGDHWIGDGERFSIMEGGDYHRLQQLFAETRRYRGKPTGKAVLEVYSEDIHKLWADDPEEFYREFYFPDSNPNSTSSSADTKITEIAPELKTKETNSGSEEGVNKREEKPQKQRTEEHQNSAANQEIQLITSQKHPSRSTQQKMLGNPIPDEKVTDTYLKFWIWIVVFAALLLVGYWWRRQTK